MKRLLYLLFCFLLFILNFSIVYAGSDVSGLSKTQLKRAENLYKYMIANGYSAQAACGVLGNADAETTFNGGSLTSGAHRGYFQVDIDVCDAMVKWADSKGLDKNDICVQFRYGEKSNFNGYASYVSYPAYKDFKSLDDEVLACEGFMAGFEKCVFGSYSLTKAKTKYPGGKTYKYQDGANRVKWAGQFLKKFANIEPDSSSGKLPNGSGSKEPNSSSSNANSNANSNKAIYGVEALNGVYYSDKQLSEYIKLGEIDVEDEFLVNSTKDLLGQEDLGNLEHWKSNVDEGSLSNRFLKFLRHLVTLCGIGLTIYAVLLYLGFWFDRLNIFLDIGVVKILTLGHLHTAIEDEDSNFTFQGWKEKKIAVAHRQITLICLICLGFGVIIISGKVYSILLWLINLVFRFVGV